MEANNAKWGAAFIVWNLAGMFGGESKETFESFANKIGMFSPEKKSTIKIDKQVEIDKSAETMKLFFNNPGLWE